MTGKGRSTRAPRLPLCGFEFYQPPSNDLEKTPMTDTPKKKRNPRELPISEAIEKLRSLYAERDAELEKVVEHATKKVYEQFGKRFERVIVRVPVDLHAHVQERAKAKQKKNGTTPESDEGQGAAYKSEGYGFNEPGSDEPHPDWLDAPAPPVDRIEVDRSTGETRRVGAGRAK